MEIELTKGSGGLGFTLAGGANTVGGCFVRDIIGGPALTDGRLKPGDQILKVDDIDITAMKHMDAVNVLRGTKRDVKLAVLRRTEGVVGSGRSGTIEAVNLTRTTKGRIGLLLREGEDDGGIYVEDVVPGEPAATQGNLRTGDRIVEIAGQKVDGIGFVRARQLLDQARPVARLLVERGSRLAESKYTMGDDDGRGSDSGIPTPSWTDRAPSEDEAEYHGHTDDDDDEEDGSRADSSKDEHFTVQLVKGTRGFGFSLVAAAASELEMQGIFIKTITTGSVADEDGRLKVGDQILKVNGDDVMGLSHARVIGMLRKVTGTVELEIRSNIKQNGVSSALVKVQDGGRYSGQRLKMLISSLQGKLDSNVPADEFNALREVKATDGCDSAKKPANKNKNRYRKFLPFETTRVKLDVQGSDDYINASHVKVRVGQDEYDYIASQGPLPNTTKDFWQMIWEQNVDVIAMVTLEREGGKVKCHRYWPETREHPLVFPSELAVSLRRKQLGDFYIEREFRVRHIPSGETMDVTHLNFTRWPDHGVPKCASEMLEFVRHTRQSASGAGPIVVHCSLGIGRTGTLITVDVALGLMERDQPFDINTIIRNLREQRHGMIQTMDQYIFCYKACLEVLLSLQ